MRLITKVAIIAFSMQALSFALTGKVQDSQGNALSGVMVTLISAGHSTTTNISGDFTLLPSVKIKTQGVQAHQFEIHQGVLTYQLSKSALVQFQVLNLMGQELQSSPKQLNNQGLHVYALSQKLRAGLYILRYQIGNDQGTLPLQVTQVNQMSLRTDLQRSLKKTAEGAEDSLQLEIVGYYVKRVAVMDYDADLGVIEMIVAQSSSSTSVVGNPQTCTYSTSKNTLTCAEKTYKTVVIGTQTWMAENLNYGSMVTINQTKNAVVEKFCYPNSLNCTIDGGLYTWADAMALPSACNSTKCATQISYNNHQGICPIGWHIPKGEEWNTLSNYLGGSDEASKKMKLNNTGFYLWDVTSNDGNTSGFSAYPAGFRGDDGSFTNSGYTAFFWESSESNASSAYYRILGYDYYDFSVDDHFNKLNSFSVRCLKDNAINASSSSIEVSSSSSTVVLSSSSNKTVAGNPQICTYSPSANTLFCNEKTYQTVVIGTQTWMAENLNFGTMVLDANGQINDDLVEKFCYNDNASNCTTDGGLYTWAETMAIPSNCNGTSCAMQVSSGHHQGICPTGWHIPKAVEWNTLENYLGGSSVAGKKMKLTGTGFSDWDDITNNDGNSSGFSAFPVGQRYNDVGFYYRSDYTYYWEATENPLAGRGADSRALFSRDSYLIAFDAFDKNLGFSVRCLKDN